MAIVLPFPWCPLAMCQCLDLLFLPIQIVLDLLPRATERCCCTGIQVCGSGNYILLDNMLHLTHEGIRIYNDCEKTLGTFNFACDYH